MNFLKKLSLAVIAITFCFGLFVASSNAQSRRNGSWQNRNNSWQQRQWRNRQWQNRQGRITPQEYRRLQRERMRLIRTRNRYRYNDGYINGRERNRLSNRYDRYRRNVRRDRRDW